MPRKSSAALSIVPPSPADGRLGVPDGLTEGEAVLWREVVDSKPADWFGEDSAPLLKEYVRAALMCDTLDGKLRTALTGEDTDVELVKTLLDMRDKESKRATSIATKLRLTQQSRYTPQAAGTAGKKAGGKRPWQS